MKRRGVRIVFAIVILIILAGLVHLSMGIARMGANRVVDSSSKAEPTVSASANPSPSATPSGFGVAGEGTPGSVPGAPVDGGLEGIDTADFGEVNPGGLAPDDKRLMHATQNAELLQDFTGTALPRPAEETICDITTKGYILCSNGDYVVITEPYYSRLNAVAKTGDFTDSEIKTFKEEYPEAKVLQGIGLLEGKNVLLRGKIKEY